MSWQKVIAKARREKESVPVAGQSRGDTLQNFPDSMASQRKPRVLGHHGVHHTAHHGTLAKTASPFPGVLECLTSVGDWWRRMRAEAAIRRLFDSCLAPKTGISDDAYKQAAKDLDVEVEMIKAVSLTELSIKSAFDDEGRPTILFEPAKFQAFTNGAYDKQHPYVSNASWGSGKFSEQYKKLAEAYGLNATKALESASWGAFQIMGFNYKAAGFKSVEEMVAEMMKSEELQLRAFVNFINSDKNLHQALKDKNWADFASRYNGPGYKQNNYDSKMKTNYDALKAALNAKTSCSRGQS